jgi:hypothetical protein
MVRVTQQLQLDIRQPAGSDNPPVHLLNVFPCAMRPTVTVHVVEFKTRRRTTNDTHAAVDAFGFSAGAAHCFEACLCMRCAVGGVVAGGASGP